MSRRHKADKREINPDPKFGDLVVTKFMNAIMMHGKKSVAETIVYSALDQVQSKTRQEPVTVFHQALDNVAPHVEVRSRRVGGATYQVPVDVRPERRQALAIRWLITAARNRNETTMVDRLSGEMMDAANNRGTAVKKREDTHRMAEAVPARSAASTSSTPRATSTSPLKSSVRCACSTAPLRCSTPMPAWSRRPRPCGGRPTSITSRA